MRPGYPVIIISAMTAATVIAAAVLLQAQAPQRSSIVHVKGTQLIVQKRLPDGSLGEARPYIIKGVTWSPATRAPENGPNPADISREVPYGFFFDWPGRVPPGHEVFLYWMEGEATAHYRTDIPLMKEMNVNTVRVYNDFGLDASVNRAILDEFYRNGIMVIMAVAICKEDFDTGRYMRIVALCKDHPAILMWSLGNEWNLDYNKYYGYRTVAEAAIATEAAAKAINGLDKNHPVSTCLGDRFEDADETNTVKWIVRNCPDIAVWGLNIYRGESLGELFRQWQKTSGKPFYISEFGIDSFATRTYATAKGIYAVEVAGEEDRKAQAAWDMRMWQEAAANLSALDPKKACIGGLIHSFNDSLWKVGSYHAMLGDLINYNNPEEAASYGAYNPEGLIMKGSFPDNVANEEYFGVVDADRKPKLVFYELKKFYKNLQ